MKNVFLIGALIMLGVLSANAQRHEGPAGPPNPFVGNSEAVKEGTQIYNKNCTTCHGINMGAGIIGPAIVQPGAGTFRGQRTEFELMEKIRNGVPGTPMAAWKGKLSANDILKLGAYIHALRGMAIDDPVPGDVAHGEQIFYGKGECGSCHMIKGKGGLIGPDLSNIAAERKTVNIEGPLTKSEHRIWLDGGDHIATLPPMDTYDAVLITLKNGDKIDGVLLNQDGFSMQVMGLNNQLHLLDRADVATVVEKPPLMPTDYDKRLTATEFRDLMAFLTRQGRKEPVQQAGRTSRPSAPD